MKYSYDEKLKTVLLVLEAGHSLREVAHMLGSEQKHIRRWIALYQEYGKVDLRMKSGGYSSDFKLSVVRYMRANHLSLFEAAVHFGIPDDCVVRRRDRIYTDEGPAGLCRENRGRKKMKSKPEKPKTEARSQSELLVENEHLRAEVAYLKK